MWYLATVEEEMKVVGYQVGREYNEAATLTTNLSVPPEVAASKFIYESYRPLPLYLSKISDVRGYSPFVTDRDFYY